MAQITLNSTGVASSGSLLLQTNGTTTQATLDTSGNFLLGTTTAVSGAKATVSGSVAASAGVSVAGNAWGVLPYTASSLVVDTNAGTSRLFSIGSDASTKGAFLFYQSTSSGSATQAMTLDASGNLALNTTSPTNPANKNFTVNGGSTDAAFVLSVADTRIGQLYAASGNEVRLSAVTSVPLTFRTADTERARIDSSGNLLVGKTTKNNTSGNGFQCDSTGVVNVVCAASTGAFDTYELYSTGAGAYRFYVTGAGVVNATSTTITGISDQRLKENIRDLDDGLAKVMSLKPRKFDWKEGKGADTKNARGFIAQEFETVFPDLIDTWKDPAPEGEEPYKAVRADLIPVLVKAIQELKAEFDAYKAAHP